jgi:hypothetical protein
VVAMWRCGGGEGDFIELLFPQKQKTFIKHFTKNKLFFFVTVNPQSACTSNSNEGLSHICVHTCIHIHTYTYTLKMRCF